VFWYLLSSVLGLDTAISRILVSLIIHDTASVLRPADFSLLEAFITLKVNEFTICARQFYDTCLVRPLYIRVTGRYCVNRQILCFHYYCIFYQTEFSIN